jgi:ketol-acid reductoisomerase
LQWLGGSRIGLETMTQTGIEESAYYESLHELPLIANTVARKLYEMNRIISDTADMVVIYLIMRVNRY